MIGTMNTTRVQTDENDAPRLVLQALAPELARAYATAISLMPDQKEAEAVLIRAIESLAPNDLTANTLRLTVIANWPAPKSFTLHYKPRSVRFPARIRSNYGRASRANGFGGLQLLP